MKKNTLSLGMMAEMKIAKMEVVEEDCNILCL